nr:branched-chain amino acid ABC transporter ATP-binding protein/permease [Protofrankia coriariae]
MATSIVFLSLGLLVRNCGQVSLCQVSFMAIGAAGFSHLSVDHGLPWLVALLLAGLVAVPVGAILAIPAIRLTGLYLALATFGFGIFLQYMFYAQDYMFGPTGAGLDQPRPHLSWLEIDDDRGYYFLVLAMTVIAAGVLAVLDRGRLGRLLRGLGDSPTALETSGVTVSVTRVLVFCVSAFMAAVGGALGAVAQSTVSADSYHPLLSLTYFALIVIVLGGNPWYALTAAGALVLVPSYSSGENTATILQLVFGLAAIAAAVTAHSTALVPPAVRQAIGTVLGGRRRAARATAAAAPLPAPLPAPQPAADSPQAAVTDDQAASQAASQAGEAAAAAPVPTRPAAGAGRVRPGALTVRGLRVRYGGLVAVDELNLVAPTGRVTGLIGPNGAGKTTTFNACSGLVRPSRGSVLLDDRDVSRAGPAARARRGLGRTFQRMELFDTLSVRDNVAVGAEGTLAGGNPLSHLAGWPADRSAVRVATDRALELCDLGDLAGVPAANLSTGQRRLVELARCLAGPFRILLLDEPSAGLDRAETRRFGAILRRVVDERGVGILLVEHDMSLVLDVCEAVYVLDFGRLVFEGSAREVVGSPIVRAAYLGDALVETAAGGTAAGSAAADRTADEAADEEVTV